MINPDKKYIKIVKKRLIDLDMTQTELAQRAGVSYLYLKLIISGQRSPGKHAKALAKILKIDEKLLTSKRVSKFGR